VQLQHGIACASRQAARLKLYLTCGVSLSWLNDKQERPTTADTIDVYGAPFPAIEALLTAPHLLVAIRNSAFALYGTRDGVTVCVLTNGSSSTSEESCSACATPAPPSNCPDSPTCSTFGSQTSITWTYTNRDPVNTQTVLADHAAIVLWRPSRRQRRWSSSLCCQAVASSVLVDRCCRCSLLGSCAALDLCSALLDAVPPARASPATQTPLRDNVQGAKG